MPHFTGALDCGPHIHFEGAARQLLPQYSLSTPWIAGEDIRHGQHVLRAVADNRMADAYSSEDVWVVQVNPPCPAGQPLIALKSPPAAIGPWLDEDTVIARDEHERHHLLDIAHGKRVDLGHGAPSANGERFARIASPGWKMTALDILSARDGAVICTLDTGRALCPMSFNSPGSLLTCGASGNMLVIDALRGHLIGEIPLAGAGLQGIGTAWPSAQRLIIYTQDDQALTFTLNYFSNA